MGAYNRTYNLTNGTIAYGDQVVFELDALGSSVNNISDAQISGPITGAGKVHGSSLTGLSSIPPSAGMIPTANVPTIAAVTDLGNLNGTQALSADVLYVAVLTGSSVITLPTPTTGNLYNIMFQFTMGSAYTLTVPVTVTWNYGVTPSLSTTKVNRMMFDTIDGGTTWHGYYSQV